MRWAQGFGYGGVGPPLYGAVALPGFWAFLISGEYLKPGGDRNLCYGDTTMEPVTNFKAVRKLLSKDHSPFVILHQQKLIFISKEAGEVLDISNPAWPFRHSPTQSINKQNSLPMISSNPTNDLLDFFHNAPSHLHLSQLLSCYLQLNKPEVVAFTHWAIREVIPQADKQKKTQHFTRNGLQLMRLEDKKRHQHIRQVLVVPGGIEARIAGRISGIDEEENSSKGGEPCPNH